MSNVNYKTIDTTLSTYSNVFDNSIKNAKEYLTNNFGNQYNSPPHVTYSICPFPQHNLERITSEMSQYFSSLAGFSFTFEKLQFDKRMKFFYLPITNTEVLTLHEDMTNLSNKYRDGFIREKDAIRLKESYYNEKQKKNIETYGYGRVFSESKLHITIGNINTAEENYSHVEKELINILQLIDRGIVDYKSSLQKLSHTSKNI